MTRADADRSCDDVLIKSNCWEMQRTKAVIFAVTQIWSEGKVVRVAVHKE